MPGMCMRHTEWSPRQFVGPMCRSAILRCRSRTTARRHAPCAAPDSSFVHENGHGHECSTSGRDDPDPASTAGRNGYSNPHSTATTLEADLQRLQAFEAYRSELSKPVGEVSLLRCAALIAKATKYPELCVDQVVASVNTLALEVEKQLPPCGSRYPMRVLRCIVEVLYHQQGFRGNTVEYYLDDNSMINCVLQNRGGIPISLSLLFMEVAQRVGVPMKGLNMPAHFMLAPAVEDLEVIVDAFSGEILFLEDAEQRLSQVLGTTVRIDPAVIRESEGVPPARFLQRLLNNMKQIYLNTQQHDLALRVTRLMRCTVPGSAADMRDEGISLVALQRFTEAADFLRLYLQAQPRAEDASMVMRLLEGCHAESRAQREQRHGPPPA